ALQIAADADDAVANQPAVDLQLRLAGAADEAEAAALPFQVSPRPHEPAALIGECGQLDLQLAFARAGPLAEDLEEQAAAVDDLAFPGPLEIALLHRRQRAVDEDEIDGLGGDQLPQGGNHPAPDERRRREAAQAHDVALHDGQIDGEREADRLGRPRLGRG